MKIVFPFILLLLLISCTDKTANLTTECTGTGKHKAVVIRKGCEAYVFQILDPTIEVQSDWTDIFSKKKYSNVISVMNYCNDDTDGKALQSLNVGETITFDLVTSQYKCLIFCFAFEDAPNKTYSASNINVCGD